MNTQATPEDARTAHTPGPWQAIWYTNQGAGSWLIEDSAQTRVATVPTYGIPEPQDEANARLIASAPQLRDALEALLDQLQGVGIYLPDAPDEGHWAGAEGLDFTQAKTLLDSLKEEAWKDS